MSDELNQDDEIIEQQAADEPAPAPSAKDALKKYGLDTRWKTDDPVELVDEMGKSYANAEQALRQREAELAQMRQYLQQQQQFQQQPSRQEPVTDDDPEVKKAKDFVNDLTRTALERELMPLRQQLEQTQTELYVSRRLNSPQETQFKDAVFSGELGQEMTARGLPYTAQAVDYAFNALMYRKMSDVVAQNREAAKVEGATLEQQKQKTFMESGGKSQRQPIPSIEEIQKATASMNEAELDEYLKKKGIKLPTNN